MNEKADREDERLNAEAKALRIKKREAAAKLMKQNMFKSLPEEKPGQGFVRSVQKRIIHAHTIKASLPEEKNLFGLKQEFDRNLISS